MEKELQGKLVEILSSIQTATGKASDFALAQLPDVAQSYLMYGRISSVIYSVVGLVAFCATWWGLIKAAKSNDYDAPMIYIFGGAISLLPLFFAMLSVESALLVWIAPKVWLLKALASMVK